MTAPGLHRGPGRAAAFAPGHVTGFFEIRDEARDVLRRGSRGAGFCLDLGAASVVEVAEAESLEVEVRVNPPVDDDAPVTRDALVHVLRAAVRDGRVGLNREAPKGQRARIHVTCSTELELPVGQGFGMSAAGALSAARALARALGLGRTDAVQAAHRAEIERRTGLGDVAAQIHGGYEVRRTPGLPPYGDVRSIVGGGQVALLALAGGLRTADVLRDPERRGRINAEGAKRVDALLAEPSVEHLHRLSRSFAQDTGLLGPELQEALRRVDEVATAASMAMLGKSLYAVGPVERILEAWGDLGETYVANVDPRGVRLLDLEGGEGKEGEGRSVGA